MWNSKITKIKILSLLLIVSIWGGYSCQKYEVENKVKIFIEQKKYDKAIEEAKKEKDEKKKFNYLGVIYSRKGDLKQAEEYYNKVLKLSSNNLKASYNLVLLKIRLKKFKDGLNIIDSLEKVYPKDIDIKLKKAYLFYLLSSNSNAISILKNLVKNKRESLTPLQWKELADIYVKLKRYQAAAEAYEYFLLKVKKDKIKIDLDKIKKKINFLRSKHSEEL